MDDSVLDAARAVQARAYAPYSRFKVGATLEAEDGRMFTGCNVENAAFGVTLCAERAALAAAVAAGARQFRRLVIVSDADPPAAPCGVCRQALAEFSPGLRVEAFGPAGSRRWTLEALLPDAFGAELRPPRPDAQNGMP